MKKICEALHIENKEKEYVASMKKQLKQSLPALRLSMLNRIVCMENVHISKYLERCEGLGIHLTEGPFIVTTADLEMSRFSPEDYDLYLFAAKNITAECVGQEHYTFEDSKGRLVILFRCCVLGEDARDIVYQTLCVIQKAIYNNLKIETTCGNGSVAESAEELHASYLSARRAAECKFSLGTNNVYDIRDLDYLEKSFYYPLKETKSLTKAIKFQEEKDIRECKFSLGTNNVYDIRDLDYLEKSFYYPLKETKSLTKAIKFQEEKDIREAVCDIVYAGNSGRSLSGINMKMIYIEAVTSLLRELSDLKEVAEEIWNDGFSFFRDIDRLGTPEVVEERLFSFACKIKKEMEAVQTNSSIQIIEKVKEFVNQNYKDPELSLSSAAEFACVSTGYLSGLFKKEAGTNFVKYLTDVRMEKSMELLRTTDMKTYEIAYETGFANPHYFSVSFKKYTGMSPSDFRLKE